MVGTYPKISLRAHGRQDVPYIGATTGGSALELSASEQKTSLQLYWPPRLTFESIPTPSSYPRTGWTYDKKWVLVSFLEIFAHLSGADSGNRRPHFLHRHKNSAASKELFFPMGGSREWFGSVNSSHFSIKAVKTEPSWFFAANGMWNGQVHRMPDTRNNI